MAEQLRQSSGLEQRMNALFLRFHRIAFLQKIFFIEHLRIMIRAGLSLVEALGVLQKELENPKFQAVIAQVLTDVSSGKQLSESLGHHPKVFPVMYVSMIESGEISGKLEESLLQVERQMKKSHELLSSIRGAMIYPAVIFIAMGGVGLLMATVVLPKLLEIFKEFDAELPLATRILIVFVDVLSNPFSLALIIGSLVGGISLFVYLLRSRPMFRYTIHRIVLRLPIVGPIIKQINLAKFSLTLSSLLKSTIPIIRATEITAQTCGNMLYRRALEQAALEIQSGIPLSHILEKYPRIFPPMVREMILVGERSGELDDLLSELAKFYNHEVSKTMKNFATIIEPVIIIVLGVVVGGMAVAVVLPMYTLVQNF